MNRPNVSRSLLVAALLLLLVGVGLVIVQPGNLGDDDETALQDGTEETTSTTAGSGDGDGDVDGGDTTTSAPGDTTTSAPGDTTASTETTIGSATTETTIGSATTETTTATTTGGTTATTSAPTGGPPTTAATGSGGSGTGGSGLGADGAADPSDTSDGLANTGGESLILVGLALGLVGLGARRRLPLAPRPVD